MPPGLSPEELEKMREYHRAMREQMRAMTPEERRQAREAHQEQMRSDVDERGTRMAEMQSWVEQRRQEREAQLEKYRQTIEQMTAEQIEAARAIFGAPRSMPEAQDMPPRGFGYGYGPQPGQGPQYGYGPGGGYPGFEGYPGSGRGMGQGPMMPQYGAPGYDQGPPPPYGSGY
jgi:hypothetical protein